MNNITNITEQVEAVTPFFARHKTKIILIIAVVVIYHLLTKFTRFVLIDVPTANRHNN